MDAYRGTIVHCLRREEMEVLRDYVIGVDGGQIKFLEPADHLGELTKQYNLNIHTLSNSQFLMPGLVDAHNHAPQYSYVGVGYDMSLSERLRTYKIPTETKFSDVEVAKKNLSTCSETYPTTWYYHCLVPGHSPPRQHQRTVQANSCCGSEGTCW
jgi:guanine deaminase